MLTALSLGAGGAIGLRPPARLAGGMGAGGLMLPRGLEMPFDGKKPFVDAGGGMGRAAMGGGGGGGGGVSSVR